MIGNQNDDDIAPPTGSISTATTLPPAPPMEAVSMSPPSGSPAADTTDEFGLPDEDDEDKEKSSIEQVIPMDSLKNGAAQAMSGLSWFTSTMSKKAAEAKAQLEANETYKKSIGGFNAQLEKARQSEVAKKASEAGGVVVAGIASAGETVAKSTVQGVNYVKENAAPAMESTKKFAEEVGEKTVPMAKQCFQTVSDKTKEGFEGAKKAVNQQRGGGGHA